MAPIQFPPASDCITGGVATRGKMHSKPHPLNMFAVSNGNTGAAPASPPPPTARNPLEELYGTPEPAQPSKLDDMHLN